MLDALDQERCRFLRTVLSVSVAQHSIERNRVDIVRVDADADGIILMNIFDLVIPRRGFRRRRMTRRPLKLRRCAIADHFYLSRGHAALRRGIFDRRRLGGVAGVDLDCKGKRLAPLDGRRAGRNRAVAGTSRDRHRVGELFPDGVERDRRVVQILAARLIGHGACGACRPALEGVAGAGRVCRCQRQRLAVCLGLRGGGNASDRRISVRVRFVVHGVGHRGQLAIEHQIGGDVVIRKIPHSAAAVRLGRPLFTEIIARDLRVGRFRQRGAVFHVLNRIDAAVGFQRERDHTRHDRSGADRNHIGMVNRKLASGLRGVVAVAVDIRQLCRTVDAQRRSRVSEHVQLDLELVAIFKCIGRRAIRGGDISSASPALAIRECHIAAVRTREGDGERLSRGRIDLDRRILVRRELICIGHAVLVLGANSATQRQIVRQNRRGIVFLIPLNPERHGAAHIDHRRMAGILRIAGMRQKLTVGRARRPRNPDFIARPQRVERSIPRDRIRERHRCRAVLISRPAREVIALAHRRFARLFNLCVVRFHDERRRREIRHTRIYAVPLHSELFRVRCPIRIQFNIFGDRRCEVIRRQCHFAANLRLYTPILKDISFRMLIGGAGVLGALAVRDVDGREEGIIGAVREVIIILHRMLCARFPHSRQGRVGRNGQLVALLIELAHIAIERPALELIIVKCRIIGLDRKDLIVVLCRSVVGRRVQARNTCQVALIPNRISQRNHTFCGGSPAIPCFTCFYRSILNNVKVRQHLRKKRNCSILANRSRNVKAAFCNDYALLIYFD